MCEGVREMHRVAWLYIMLCMVNAWSTHGQPMVNAHRLYGLTEYSGSLGSDAKLRTLMVRAYVCMYECCLCGFDAQPLRPSHPFLLPHPTTIHPSPYTLPNTPILHTQESQWMIDADSITICKDSNDGDHVLGEGSFGVVLKAVKDGVQVRVFCLPVCLCVYFPSSTNPTHPLTHTHNTPIHTAHQTHTRSPTHTHHTHSL